MAEASSELRSRAASESLEPAEEEEPGLISLLAGLKAKYGLESLQPDNARRAGMPPETGNSDSVKVPSQLPAEAASADGWYTSTVPDSSPIAALHPAHSPAVPSRAEGREACPTPQSLLASPYSALPAAVGISEVGAAAGSCDDTCLETVQANAAPDEHQPALKHEEMPDVSLQRPYSQLTGSNIHQADCGTDDDVYQQLLQLEALEQQLARQRIQEAQLGGTPALSDVDGPSTNARSEDSLPGLASCSSREAWPGQSRQACDNATEGFQCFGDAYGAADGVSPLPSSFHLPWADLQQRLVQLGLPAIYLPGQAEGQPESAALFAALSSAVSECDRDKEVEVQKWKRLALQSQKGLRDTQNAERQAQRAAHQVAADCTQLQDRVVQLEHELRAKDGESERLQQRLAAHLDKADRRGKADKAAYERLKRAFAASKGATTPKAGTAFLAHAAKEMRPVDIVRVYEGERADLQEEVAIIRAENRVLEGQLQRAKASLERAGMEDGGSFGQEDHARAMARQSAAAEERATRLAEEIAMLQRELSLRPTPDQYISLQRQIDIMTRQLSVLAAEKASSATAKPSDSRKPKLKQLPTREAILRDKNLARLGLHTVEQFPKPVLIEIAQDACILLECSDALKLCDAIIPLQDTAARVPRLQRFVDDICSAVFHKGLAHVPEQWRQDSPTDISNILGCWVAELGELTALRSSMRSLLRLLGSRAGLKPNEQQPAAGDVVPLVGQLVELERAALHSKEVLQAAEAVLVAQPDLLIHQIVRQFQELFSCKTLEGVLPCMNKLYLSHTEAQTFLISLRSVLGLEAGASLEACANRVSQLLEHRQDLLGSALPNPRWHAPQSTGDGTKNSTGDGIGGGRGVVVIERPRRAELQRAAQLAVDRMAAKRNFPQVEIYVPAPRQPFQEQALNCQQ
ncbi:hypothetical protein N2152v2_006902 [Parachlorella kessleri]